MTIIFYLGKDRGNVTTRLLLYNLINLYYLVYCQYLTSFNHSVTSVQSLILVYLSQGVGTHRVGVE
jgi:hypothetical protein